MPYSEASGLVGISLGRQRRGVTLIEMVVVLVLIGMAAALVIPALLRPRSGESGLEELVSNAREAAIRRGETVFLRVGESGEWKIEGAATSSGNGALLAGRVDPLPAPLTLLVTPTGSCMLDVPSAAAAPGVRLDPLTCEVELVPVPRTAAVAR